MVYTALSDDSSTQSQFTRKEAIVVTTTGTNTPSNYQAKLTITYEYEMQSDFDDIRFNTKDGRYIDYWIESYVASTSAIVWVELPDAITDPGSDTIWMYYGNASLSDGGDISNTFDFGDDFEGVDVFSRISQNTLWSGSGSTDWLGRTYMVDNDGTWIVVYRQGDAHIGNGDAVYHIRFSDDEGATWTDPDTLLNDDPVSGFPISGSDSKDAEGANIMIAPNGDLIVQSCERTLTGELDATYQYRSTNDGATWSSEGKINDDSDFLGGHVSDSVNVGSVMYLAITSNKYANFDSACLYRSINNGTTWTFVSDITTSNTNEPGIEYLGNNTLLVLLRTSDKTKTYQRISTDMGETWETLTDVTLKLGVFQRAQLRIYSDEPNRVYAVGRDDLSPEWTVVYYTDDDGSNWSTKFHPDVTGYTDAAYCDMLKKSNGDFYLLSYGGDSTAAVIKEYIFDKGSPGIDGTKWDMAGTPVIDNGKVLLDDDDKIVSKIKFGYGYIFESSSKANEQDSGFLAVRETLANENNVLYILNSDADSNDDFDEMKLYTTEGGASTTTLQDNWNDFRTQYRRYSIYRPAADDVTFVQDEHSYNQTSGNIPTVDLGLGLYVWDSSQESTLEAEWCFVRKYIVNEPTVSHGPVIINDLSIQRWMEFETIDSISIGAKTFKCQLENTDNSITDSFEAYDTAGIYIDGTTVFNGRIEEIIPNESEATIELAGKDYMGDLIGEYIIENYGISQDMSNNESAGSDVVIEITDTTGFEVDDEIKIEDDNDAETAVITAVVTNTSITVATLTNSYTTAANAKVTVGRPGSYIVNDLVLKYGSSMTRVGIQTSTNKFIILFKGITAFDAIQYIADSEEFEFGQDQDKDFFYQPRTFEDSGLSIDLDVDDVMDYSFPRPGYEIINRVDIYGGTSGGVQVAIRVEDPTSQNYYGIIKGMTIIDEKITTELQAQARANAILSEKAWVIQIGELSVLGYETLQAGQLVSLANFDSIDDGLYLVTEKMHLEPPGNTLIKVAEYRAELEDVIIDLLKRMRAREKEAMDEDAFQTKFLNFYVTSLNADVLVNVIKVDINDGYIAAHKTNSLAGRGYDGVGGNQLKVGRYQTETVII